MYVWSSPWPNLQTFDDSRVLGGSVFVLVHGVYTTFLAWSSLTAALQLSLLLGSTTKKSASSSQPSAFLQCFNAQELLATYHVEDAITTDDFVQLCPAIVLQIDEHACSTDHTHYDRHRHGDDPEYSHDPHHHNHNTMAADDVSTIPMRAWWEFWKISWKGEKSSLELHLGGS